MGGDYYWWYKNHGICTNCHKEKAERGKSLCWMCRLKNLSRERKPLTEEQLEEKRKRARERYHRMKALHLCPCCGKPAGRTVRCDRCEKLMNYRRLKRNDYDQTN